MRYELNGLRIKSHGGKIENKNFKAFFFKCTRKKQNKFL